MKKRKIVMLVSLCLMAVGVFLYACTDKTIEIDETGQASTRAIEEQLVNEYYRVLPGTSEWKSLESGDEMFQVSQLPESMLRELSTEELVDACMQFPLAYDFLLANDERYTTSFAIHNFNGLAELSKRNDGIIELLKVYRSMPYSEEATRDSGIYRVFAFSLGYIELILADPSFIDKMSEEELYSLRVIALDRYQEKIDHLGYMNLSDIRRSLLVLAEIELKTSSLSGNDLEIIKKFQKNYMFSDDELLEEVSRVLIK